MATGDVHVLYKAATEQWVVKEEGSNVSSLHASKWEAVSAGRLRTRSSRNGAQLLVHAQQPREPGPEALAPAVQA